MELELALAEHCVTFLFLSRVSILTRYTDNAILFVCLSVHLSV